MEYNTEGLNKLAEQFHEFQVKMGFTDANISQRMMLIHSEISEAFEAYRKDRFANLSDSQKLSLMGWVNEDDFKMCFTKLVRGTFEEELVDFLIRGLAFCGENNIDVEYYMKAKMRYNKTRGHKYGGKKF